MATLDNLPTEILFIIASFCEYGCLPEDTHRTQRTLASLVLVNRRLRDVFDPILWRYNGKHGIFSSFGFHVKAAVYWASLWNKIDVLEKALKYEHRLGSYLRGDPIHCATRHGHTAAVSWLIDHGVPMECSPCERIQVDSPFPVLTWPRDCVATDYSVLHTAIKVRAPAVAVFLLSRGAKYRFKNRLELTALHLAASHGLPTVIKYLVKTMGIDVNLEDEQHSTPLHYATQRRNNQTTIQTLLHLGADINAEHNSQLPLTRAIVGGCFSNAMTLLDAGAMVNPTNVSHYTSTPLIACTWKEHKFKTPQDKKGSPSLQIEVLRRLIKAGAALDECFAGDTALCTAIEEGTAATVFELLKAGADPTKPRDLDHHTPFDLIWTLDGHVNEIVGKASLLIAAGVRLDTPLMLMGGEYGYTQLDNAVSYCVSHDSRPLYELLRLATHENVRDGYLDELFGICLNRRELEPAKILMRHGATIANARLQAYHWTFEILTDLRSTPDLRSSPDDEAFGFCLGFLTHSQLGDLFSLALRVSSEERCHTLIDHGALSPLKNKKNRKFRPWLHLAAYRGSVALIRRLTKAGMDINALDDEFKTPMLAALEFDESEGAALLFELGADPFHPRSNAECRRLPCMSGTQILSPFEFSIRENRLPEIRKWWLESPPESRPTEEFYIPCVLTRGPWHQGFLKYLRSLSSNDVPEIKDEKDLEWVKELDMRHFDKDAERKLMLMQTMEELPDVPEYEDDDDDDDYDDISTFDAVDEDIRDDYLHEYHFLQ
ncbi:ankyrin [Jackrogersella minutella]|nr:ankyrin [Jackrogersella minutella]